VRTHRRVASLLTVAVLLATLALPLAGRASRAAQDDQTDLRDRANAAAAAQHLLDLAAQADYLGMYDSLHPDARVVFPRAAAVGVLTEVYGTAAAGTGQVVGVDIGQWEWPVTGTAYDRAAEVTFVLPIKENDGTVWVESQMYLVQEGDDWRWFLGDSPDFVADAIAQYGDSDTAANAPAAGSLLEGNMIQNVVNDLDAFYKDVISYTSFTYQSPGVVVVPQGEGAMSACGPAQGTFAGFYCPPDQTLYLDEAFMLSQDPFAGAFVIAHEWAHHIQTSTAFVRVGPGEEPSDFMEVYSIELEIMADCMSGAWAADATARGVLQEGDIEQALDFALNVLGDPAYVGPYDPQAHGTGEQRKQAILNGYEQGFLACNVSIDA
jgi:predicted metalloprotease